MPKYTEADISSAINAVLNGVSLRKAACDYGIPRQTLSNRILGAQANSQAKEDTQRLSPAVEKRLVDYILKQESSGYAMTHAQIRGLVEKILQSGGDTDPLGQHWMEGFFRRNP